MTPEGKVKKDCMELLKKLGWLCWRNQVVSGRLANGAWIRAGTNGLPDLMAIIPVSGRALFIECKKPATFSKKTGKLLKSSKGVLSLEQRKFLKDAAEAGAFCCVVSDAAQLQWYVWQLTLDPHLTTENAHADGEFRFSSDEVVSG